MIRTARIPFLQSRAAAPLLFMTVAVIGVGGFVVMGPLAALFKFDPLPASYFPWLAAIILGYIALTQVVKTAYVRRYGWQ